MDLVLKHLETLGERRLKERLVTEREDHFQLFLFIAFLLLLGETLLRNRKRERVLKFVLPIFALFVLTAFIDTPRSLVQKGNRLNKEKKYQSAVENYRKAEVARPNEPVIRYNLGTSLYQLYEYRDAEKELEQALAQAKDSRTQAKILYNSGNAKYRLGDFEKAIESYKKVLDLDPKDEDAKYNLEFLQKKKAQFETKHEERQKEQPKKQPQPQQQQKEDESQPQPKPQPEQEGQQDQNEPQPQPKEEESKQAKGGEKKEEEKSEGQQREEQEKREQQKQEQELEKELEKQSEQQKKEEEQKREQETEGKEAKLKEEPREGSPQEKPLQGQMAKESALRILDTLREEEKKLQDLRRPPIHPESQEVLKDW